MAERVTDKNEIDRVKKTVLPIVGYRNGTRYSLGSAVVIAPDIIITNNHVIGKHGDVKGAKVIGPDGKEYPLQELIATSSAYDTSVLKVKVPGGGGIPGVVPAVIEREVPRPGAEITAYGYPGLTVGSSREGDVGPLSKVTDTVDHSGGNITGNRRVYHILTNPENQKKQIVPGMSGGGVLEWRGGKPILLALNSQHAYSVFGEPTVYSGPQRRGLPFLGGSEIKPFTQGPYAAFVSPWEAIMNGKSGMGRKLRDAGIMPQLNFRVPSDGRRSSLSEESSLAGTPSPENRTIASSSSPSTPSGKSSNSAITPTTQDNLSGVPNLPSTQQAATLTSAMVGLPASGASSMTASSMEPSNGNLLTASTG
ncbi:MAG: serine protease [Holosporales bacterium]|jgi:hypothetical protein